MFQRVCIVLLLLLVAALVLRQAQHGNAQTCLGEPQDLHSGLVLNSGPVNTSPVNQNFDWFNPFSFPIYVRSVTLWQGMDIGTIADFGTAVIRTGGDVLVNQQWDHYAEPTDMTSHEHNFAPNFYRLGAGEKLRLQLRFIAATPPTAHAHAAALVRWTDCP